MLFLVGVHLACQAQIVWTDPPFPTVEDEITIYYDATQGSGELEGVEPVFMHTGVVTAAGGAGNWQYVQGNWGTFDGNTIMTSEGDNIHSKTINIIDYYGVPAEDEVVELAFVFRNQDGSLEGKTVDYQDIFLPIYTSTTELIIAFESPSEDFLIVEEGEEIPITVNVNQSIDQLEIFIEDVLVQSTANSNWSGSIMANGSGTKIVTAQATKGEEVVSDQFSFIIIPEIIEAEPPANTQNGLNRIDESTALFQLWAPYKNNVCLIGDFNNWTPQEDYFMKRSADGERWWIELNDLEPNTEYAYQYLVDGSLRIADPYSEKILDKWHDGYITDNVYPDLKAYPLGAGNVAATAFKTTKDLFNWQHDDFELPPKENLVVYELLLRDFSEERSFNAVLERLDYLDSLGINAIELMPVHEFEGNDSWGYNVSFHMALDKYYGTPEAFKTLVDACHERGIAVIIDMVFNHAFSQSPLCQLYWNQSEFRPLPQNPWLNMEAAHPYNVGYDFDHEAIATQEWMDQVSQYWFEEYHVDGFRYDLSKGFTQNYTNNVGVWSSYDAERIALLKRAGDAVWSYKPEALLILEHFGDKAEEQELTDHGFMTWGNANHEYNEASMGYSSYLASLDHQSAGRGMNSPSLIGYMESHDEERLMYKNLEYGNSGPDDYDVTDLETALQRQALVGAFLFATPGPKMIWQFGELGFDYSINWCTDGSVDENCRLTAKPVRWDYLEDPNRVALYNAWKEMIQLKTQVPVFRTEDYSYNLSSKFKYIDLQNDSTFVKLIGNFDVQSNDLNITLPHSGTWYEYFSGDSISIGEDASLAVPFEAGEYRIYSDVDLSSILNAANEEIDDDEEEEEEEEMEEPILEDYVVLGPNPSTDVLHLELGYTQSTSVEISIFDSRGRQLFELFEGSGDRFEFEESVAGRLSPGIYLIKVKSDDHEHVLKWVLLD